MGKKRTYYKKQQIPFFIGKLRSILQNQSNKQIISWHDSGNAFLINDQNLLINQILPEHFNHNNMASFVRQLNLYGFRKLQNVMQYCHENFKENQPQKSKLIKRIVKIKNQKQNKIWKNKQKQKLMVHDSQQLESLIQENKKLKQEQKTLLKSKRQGEKALKKLKIYVKNMRQQIQPIQKQKDDSSKQLQISDKGEKCSTKSIICKNNGDQILNMEEKPSIKRKRISILKKPKQKQKEKKEKKEPQQQLFHNDEQQKKYEEYSQNSMDDLNSPNSDEYIDSVMNSYFS